ncbi:uncharacterized protein N7511_001385 [Penicillium nucicola]|uniref:uncharacterized protein n=1 Tax=Penicillium nucicola TaxID=1850975 RepID=UPI002545A02B|nr:uncharacterized protein N7511_001385 [Penicillium nucicola]KAJ5776374.1 hypothetical protein N7511_001385 [Penicillium nucicola]
MVAISELLQCCLAQFVSLINSGALSDHIDEVPLQEWTDELGRLRVWAANIGGHQTSQSSLDYRLRDASHIKSQIVRLLEQFQELLADLKDVFEENSDVEPEYDKIDDLEDSESESSSEIQEIHQGLVDTINQLYQISMIIRKPAQHDRLIGTKTLDSEPFQFWAKQHISNKYPNADALVIDRISSAMARQRAILKYRERHRAKLSQGISSENDSKSAILSETIVTDVLKEIPGQVSDMASDAGVSETSYGGTLLEGTGAVAPKIPPIPKGGLEKRCFECPYCFYIITVQDRKAWARHIFHDLLPYVCIFTGCSTPKKLYKSRREWYHHIKQNHAMNSSTHGTYNCSICKQGSLPAVTFQRHVGQHLEELALFLLPRTDDSDEEGSELNDENLSNVSLDDHSMEHSAGQRNDMDVAATPASDSNVSDDNYSRGLRKKIEDYEPSLGATLSERESLGGLESNMANKTSAPSSPSNREYKFAMSQKLLEKSDFRQNMDVWQHQQEVEQLQKDLQKSRGHRDNERERINVNLQPDSHESLLFSEELEYDEDISERKHQSANEERKAEEELDKHTLLKEGLKVLARMRDGEGQRETLVQEEKWKERIRLKKEEEEREKLIQDIRDEEARKARDLAENRAKKMTAKAAAVAEWKQEQERIKQRQADMAAATTKEFNDQLRSMGYSDEQIEVITTRRKKGEEEDKRKDNKKEEKKTEEENRLTWIKVHRRHLLPETVEAYNLPWDWDERDSDYIIIKRWVDDDLLEELFAHTRRERAGKLNGQISSPTTGPKLNDRLKDKMYLTQSNQAECCADDLGDIVHGMFLDPARCNAKVVHGCSDISSFEDIASAFEKVTGRESRFQPLESWYDFDTRGVPVLDDAKMMFGMTQDSDGYYFGPEAFEKKTASELKRSMALVLGVPEEGQELMTAESWFCKNSNSW